MSYFNGNIYKYIRYLTYILTYTVCPIKSGYQLNLFFSGRDDDYQLCIFFHLKDMLYFRS